MKRIAGILALVPAIAFAQARIEGRVVDTAGQPIARVSLRLNNTMPSEILLTELPVPGFAAESSDDGSFVIENIEPGRGYHLAARRPGFATELFGATPAAPTGTAIDVANGQIVQGLVLVLTQHAVITGRITDVNGDPVDDARVVAWNERFVRGKRQLFPPPNANAVANDRGEYRLAGLRPGRVRISVTSLIVQPGATERDEPTFFPNTPDPGEARVFDLQPGDQLSGIDVQLRRTPVFNVRGKVVDASGKPVPGTMLRARPEVILSPIASTRARTTVRNADGTFELRGVPPGRHSIQTTLGAIVADPNFRIPPYLGSVDITVTDRDLEGVVLTVAPGAVVNGRIVYPDGDISQTLASPPPQAVRRSIALMPQAAAERQALFQPQPDGAFRMEGLEFAPHTLRQDVLPDTVYIRSVLFNGSDVTHSPIDLSDGGGDLEIILSGNPADISGIVEGARTGPLVALWPEQPNRNDYDGGLRTLTTDQNGAFRFGGLAPGVYLVAAWDGAEEGLLLNEAFRTKFTDAALRLEVAEGSHHAIEAPVIPATRIAEEAGKLP